MPQVNPSNTSSEERRTRLHCRQKVTGVIKEAQRWHGAGREGEGGKNTEKPKGFEDCVLSKSPPRCHWRRTWGAKIASNLIETGKQCFLFIYISNNILLVHFCVHNVNRRSPIS